MVPSQRARTFTQWPREDPRHHTMFTDEEREESFAAQEIVARLFRARLGTVEDVLRQAVMSRVDGVGRPGLLEAILGTLLASLQHYSGSLEDGFTYAKSLGWVNIGASRPGFNLNSSGFPTVIAMGAIVVLCPSLVTALGFLVNGVEEDRFIWTEIF
ncbi:hypothetical protein BCR34DRAFT_186350 [Clohesyomyces aquaticus]|uniref:Uncharacterized protein n=1 Tax=Clohesyomyces aquaticus TaxID=1231657 RepID=A0A1Y1YEK6_9PLEO|nr:hypothetical protein BCR34DRAFT_186350 [Clohesyomyces aquaticus]